MITIALIVLFYFKSEYEESQLISKYRDYSEYKNNTGRFFPWF
jgi:protein-S-isoprenylcysteine O-methyltransferase Ste14